MHLPSDGYGQTETPCLSADGTAIHRGIGTWTEGL